MDEMNTILPQKLNKLKTTMLEWHSSRALYAVAKREEFETISPETVSKVLNRFAVSSPLLNVKEGETRDIVSVFMCRTALLRVWELSDREFSKNNQLKFKWNRVMAVCNAIYEKLSIDVANEPETVESGKRQSNS